MALQGNIDSFSVVDVLRLLASSTKSGRLVVDGDRGTGVLWLDEGRVVAGTTARPGLDPVGAQPSDVLFDLLRFVDGSFVFEAGEVPSEAARSVGAVPAEIEALIGEAERSMAEWSGIVAVVPSLRSQVSLVLDLPGESVELDRAAWSGVVAVAAGAAHLGGTTVESVADLLSLGELGAMRLIRDLVAAGVVEVGAEAAPQHVAAVDSAVLESAGGDPVMVGSAMVGEALVEDFVTADAFLSPPPPFEAGPFTAPTPDPTDLSDDVAPPAYEPAPAAHAAVPPPIGDVGTPESFDVFAPFDPFGTAASENASAAHQPAGGEAPMGLEPSDVGSASDIGSVAEVAEVAEPVESAEDEAARQAEFDRQLAMLSPRAAEAVKSADAGPPSADEERARVARFLGSV